MLVMAGPGFRCRAMCLSFGWGNVFELRVGFVRQGFRMGVRPRHERSRETVWLERFLMWLYVHRKGNKNNEMMIIITTLTIITGSLMRAVILMLGCFPH